MPPLAGTFQALLTTASINSDFHNFARPDAVPADDLRAFLNLGAGTLSPAFDGSAIRQTFTASAGDTVAFDYKFLPVEGISNDFAFVTRVGLSDLADTNAGPFIASALDLDPMFGDPTRETAWRTFALVLPAAGTYKLGIGVADAGDEFFPSGLLIDAVRQTPAAPSAAAVPEPGSLALFAVACGCLAAFRRRRRVGSRH